jgi:hypothetical protein
METEGRRTKTKEWRREKGRRVEMANLGKSLAGEKG